VLTDGNVIQLPKQGNSHNDPGQKASSPLTLDTISTMSTGQKQASIVQWLLMHGADVNAKTRLGKTALHLVCHSGKLRFLPLSSAVIN
jgi:ankyrin repeat protein